MKSKQFRIAVILFLLAGASPQVPAQDKSSGPAQASAAPPRTSQTYTQEGVSVEFGVEPVTARKGKTSELLAGTEATMRFKISDTNEGKGISNLHPTAWVDRRESGSTDARECREKIQSFLQPSFSRRPLIDLNTYFILSLNHESNISVIDPIAGFGGSKLYTMVGLRSSGEDWVLSADKKRLYVSMPQAGAVAVIDTTTWKVVANVDAGMKPTRIALQNDGKYLWAGNDAEEAGSGVTVIDTESLKVAAQLKTGAGHHDIALAADDSRAFVTNKQDGTLSVIDVRTLAKIADIKVGGLPVAAVFSSLSKAIYVANEGDGAIVVVDGQRREVVARIKAEPGLRTLRIVPDGRFGFAVNPVTNRVYIFDISSSRLTHVVPVGPGADQVTFTSQFAYVRSAGSEFVMMIKIADLSKEADVAVTRFPAGQKPPKFSPVSSSLADAVIPAPGEDAVLVANPADKMIYYYAEGMAAPMGSFQNYSRAPKALLILDNSLDETARGVYTTTIRLPEAGHYDVAFLLDSPRVVNCFDIVVAENPALPKETAVALKVEQVSPDVTLRVGESYSLRFKVIDLVSNQPRADIADMGVLVMLAPGIWQQRDWARPRGGGLYEMSFVPPQSGVYYVYFQAPSLGVRLNQISPLMLQAVGR